MGESNAEKRDAQLHSSVRHVVTRSSTDGRSDGGSYRVVCISIYDANLDRCDALVEELKKRPKFARASRSWLIRLALSRLELDSVTEADRP